MMKLEKIHKNRREFLAFPNFENTVSQMTNGASLHRELYCVTTKYYFIIKVHCQEEFTNMVSSENLLKNALTYEIPFFFLVF